MQALKTLWNKIKATLMFVWRHLFTLFVGALALNAFLFATYNPIIWRVGVTFAAAIAFDWLKMKFKCGTGSHSRFERIVDNRNDWNPNIVGTSAYIRDLGNNRYY